MKNLFNISVKQHQFTKPPLRKELLNTLTSKIVDKLTLENLSINEAIELIGQVSKLLSVDFADVLFLVGDMLNNFEDILQIARVVSHCEDVKSLCLITSFILTKLGKISNNGIGDADMTLNLSSDTWNEIDNYKEGVQLGLKCATRSLLSSNIDLCFEAFSFVNALELENRNVNKYFEQTYMNSPVSKMTFTAIGEIFLSYAQFRSKYIFFIIKIYFKQKKYVFY